MESKVCQLDKSIYGLRQAPLLFFKENDKVMKGFGLESAEGDRCIYIRRTGDELTIVITHVDDSFVASTNKEVLVQIATHLGNNSTDSLCWVEHPS